jgi:heme/copper-type cytochrome/quinol oxidase subunit 2
MKKLLSVLILAVVVMFAVSAEAKWVKIGDMSTDEFSAFYYDDATVAINMATGIAEADILATMTAHGKNMLLQRSLAGSATEAEKESTKQMASKGTHMQWRWVFDYRQTKWRLSAVVLYGNKDLIYKDEIRNVEWLPINPGTNAMTILNTLRKAYNF